MIPPIRFTKTQSIGNDFVLVLDAAISAVPDLSALAIAACDRHRGIGADGLLVLGQGPTLRMFNPDGTEDFCGNGIRCAAAIAHELGWFTDSTELEHFGRMVRVHVDPAGPVATELGRCSYEPANIPVADTEEVFLRDVEIAGETLTLSTLSTGTAHTVIVVPELPTDERFRAISADLEVHALFPERTSVCWVQPHDEHTIQLRIWERGVGETLGCGTGSAASAAQWMRMNGSRGPVKVINRGGELTVNAESWDAPLTLIGVPHQVFTGEFLFHP